jgi:two-component system NtrC family sensor kinase
MKESIDPAGCAPTILVVEDERPHLELYLDILSHEGYTVHGADSAETALDLLRQTDVALILTDYNLPGTNGAELLTRARQYVPNAIGIIMSGVLDPAMADAVFTKARAFRFLMKPFDRKTLTETVEKALERWREVSERHHYLHQLEALVQQKEEERHSSDMLLFTLLDALPAGVITLDETGTVTTANPAAQKILLLPVQDIIGKTASKLGLPDSKPTLVERASGKSGYYLHQLFTGPGNRVVRSILWSSRTLPVSRGAATTLAAFLDVTDKEELETQVFHAKQEIEALFDSITDPTFLLDEKLRVIRANKALVTMLGKPFLDVVGQRHPELFPYPDDRGEDRTIQEVFTTGKAARYDFRTAEGRILKAHYFPMRISAKVRYVVGRYQDVTEERELEQQLMQSERLASIGQLAAGVAHEINTPVGFILSNLNRLEEYCQTLTDLSQTANRLSDEVQGGACAGAEAWEQFLSAWRTRGTADAIRDLTDIVSECQTGAKRIRNIIQNMKTFSRRRAETWSYADLGEGIESTFAIVWNELKYKCEVVRELGPLPKIYCIPDELNQVFLNLLVNAADAITGRGTVTVRTWAENGNVFILVADTGCGIPPEIQKNIFDPFFTTKPVGKGTGLGLHISLDIVRKHHGEIRVESAPGFGSKFTVVLPTEQPADAEIGG